MKNVVSKETQLLKEKLAARKKKQADEAVAEEEAAPTTALDRLFARSRRAVLCVSRLVAVVLRRTGCGLGGVGHAICHRCGLRRAVDASATLRSRRRRLEPRSEPMRFAGRMRLRGAVRALWVACSAAPPST